MASNDTSHDIIVNLENLQNENIKHLIQSTNIKLNGYFENPKELETNKSSLKMIQHDILMSMNNIIDLDFRNKSIQTELLSELKNSYIKTIMLLKYYDVFEDRESDISKIKSSVNALIVVSCSMFILIVIFLAVILFCYGT